MPGRVPSSFSVARSGRQGGGLSQLCQDRGLRVLWNLWVELIGGDLGIDGLRTPWRMMSAWTMVMLGLVIDIGGTDEGLVHWSLLTNLLRWCRI